jgi:hypothetical protein
MTAFWRRKDINAVAHRMMHSRKMLNVLERDEDLYLERYWRDQTYIIQEREKESGPYKFQRPSQPRRSRGPKMPKAHKKARMPKTPMTPKEEWVPAELSWD